MSGTPPAPLDPKDPRAGDPTNPATWITIGGVIIIIVVIGCDLSRPLTIGRTYTAAEMGPLSCTIGMQGDTEVNAYWAESSFVNGALAGFKEFPACLSGGTPGYCPPATTP